jgi:HK97 gp10 family phage protein
MAEFGLKIDGVDALLKVMDGIEQDMESANGQATLAGARVIQKEAKARCPVGDEPKTGKYPHQPGNLRRSIKIKLTKPQYPGQRLALIGPAVGKKEKFDGFYGKWVEEGHTKVHATGSHISKWRMYKGQNVSITEYTAIKTEFGDSKTKAKPFLRPAYDEKINEAQKFMTIEYQKAIEQKMDKGKTLDALSDIIEGD